MRYVGEDNGRGCPFCGSQNVQKKGRLQDEGDEIYRTIVCQDCHREWQKIYYFGGVIELEVPCGYCGEFICNGEEYTTHPHEGLAHTKCQNKR